MRAAIAIFVAFSVLAVIAFPIYAVVLSTSVGNPQDRAAFGEMFGALGALFSALAFAAVTCSIFLQALQLRHQSEDAKETRDQVERQLRLTADTTAELAKTARLNALAILAKAYGESLAWMDTQTVDKSSAKAEVSQLHEWAITQVEQLAGMESGGLHFEKPTADRPADASVPIDASLRRPKLPSGSFTFDRGSSPPSGVDES